MERVTNLLLKDSSSTRADISLREKDGIRVMEVGGVEGERKTLSLGAGGAAEVRAYFDGSVLEVIADNRAAVTVRSYGPGKRGGGGDGAVGGSASGPARVRELEVWKMKAISGDRLTT